MKNNKARIVWIVVAFVSFLANPHGPLGTFWAPSPMSPEPVGLQMPLFMILNVAESVALASSVVLALFYFPQKALANLTLKETRLAFAGLLWIMGNWWMHDALHIHIGMDLHRLLFVEYGFHITMMIAAAYIIKIIFKMLKKD